jgi:acetolactate synthase-1/2/3 large subunit
MNELITAARYNIPVIEVVMNNSVLGMVRQWQGLFYEGRYSQTTFTDDLDYAAIATAMGARGIRVETKEEAVAAVKEALKANGPVLIDCRIDRDDMVFPMSAPGQPIEEAFDQDDM